MQLNQKTSTSLYTCIPNDIIFHPVFQKLPRGCVQTYLILRTYSDQNGKPVWPSLSTIAQKIGVHRNTIRNRLRSLVQFGFISIQERPGRTGLISFNQELTLKSVPSPTKDKSPSVTNAPKARAAFIVKKEPKLDKKIVPHHDKQLVPPPVQSDCTQTKQIELFQDKINKNGPESTEASDLIKGTVSWESYTAKLFTKDVLKEFLSIRVDTEFQAAVRKKIDDCFKKGREWLFYPYAISQFLKDNPKVEFESKVIFSALNNPENWEEIRNQANTAYLNARHKWEASNFLVIQRNKVDSIMAEPKDGKERRSLSGLSDLYKSKLAEKSENLAKES